MTGTLRPLPLSVETVANRVWDDPILMQILRGEFDAAPTSVAGVQAIIAAHLNLPEDDFHTHNAAMWVADRLGIKEGVDR